MFSFNLIVIASDYKEGLYFNTHFDSYNTTIKNFGKPTCCPEWNSGAGRSFDLGGLFYYKYLQELLFGLDIGFQTSNGKLSFVENEVINVGGTDFDGKFEHIANISYFQISLSPSIIYYLDDYFRVRTGINFAYLLNPEFKQYEEIIYPLDRGVFKDTKTRKRNEFSGEIQNSNPFQFGVFLSVSYPFQLNNKNTISLNPEIIFNYYLSNIVSDYKFSKYGIGVGFYILFE